MDAVSSDELVMLQAAVAGRYNVEREIGPGGMGIVYRGRDLALERTVAIKLLPPALAAHDELRERFLREARTAASLAHPNIVPIHLVEARDDVVFFVMGYVDGETLSNRVRRAGVERRYVRYVRRARFTVLGLQDSQTLRSRCRDCGSDLKGHNRVYCDSCLPAAAKRASAKGAQTQRDLRALGMDGRSSEGARRKHRDHALRLAATTNQHGDTAPLVSRICQPGTLL